MLKHILCCCEILILYIHFHPSDGLGVKPIRGHNILVSHVRRNPAALQTGAK